MEKSDIRYKTYIDILREELIPAMGCTEPIALAYAASKARQALGCDPDRVLVEASGSIIKNVKSVIVPNTGHMKGIAAATAVGIVAGDPDKELEVISEVNDTCRNELKNFIENVPIEIEHIDKGHVFDIIISLFAGNDYAKVRISDYHTNIILIEKNKKILFEASPEYDKNKEDSRADRSILDIEGVYDFAESVDIEDVRPILEPQIQYNTAISEEGLLGNYGANIGSVLLHSYGNDIKIRAKAKAAAGSDARMNGCELPVIINSGSGNQGITCSVPVIEYAKELMVSKEKLYRALVISNLTAIHQKSGIGTLSAFCGAVSAGAGAGAGIAYLCDGSYDAIIHTIVNALAVVSGIVCDGAKASCAAKIASSVDAGIMGFYMYKNGQEFKGGDGIIVKGIEATIRNIARLGKDGMRETNEEIIDMMVKG